MLCSPDGAEPLTGKAESVFRWLARDPGKADISYGRKTPGRMTMKTPSQFKTLLPRTRFLRLPLHCRWAARARRGCSGTGREVAAERRELGFCRAGPLQPREAEEPAHKQPAWGWATQVLAALAPRTELVGRARPFLHRSALHRLLLGLRRLHQEPPCHHASLCKHLLPAIGQHKCKDHRCSTINIANFLPLQTVSSPPFSLQEKFYHAENSHSKVICKSIKQIVHRASKIIRCEGYVQSLKCQMLLQSLEKQITVYHEIQFSALTLH